MHHQCMIEGLCEAPHVVVSKLKEEKSHRADMARWSASLALLANQGHANHDFKEVNSVAAFLISDSRYLRPWRLSFLK